MPESLQGTGALVLYCESPAIYRQAQREAMHRYAVTPNEYTAAACVLHAHAATQTCREGWGACMVIDPTGLLEPYPLLQEQD